MSSKGYIDSVLNALPADQKRVLTLAFHEVQDRGQLGANTKATNFAWYQVSSTTAAVANTEVVIPHGLPYAPQWIIPVVDATSSGAQLVPLKVTRKADAANLYLASSSTSAPFTVFVE